MKKQIFNSKPFFIAVFFMVSSFASFAQQEATIYKQFKKNQNQLKPN